MKILKRIIVSMAAVALAFTGAVTASSVAQAKTYKWEMASELTEYVDILNGRFDHYLMQTTGQNTTVHILDNPKYLYSSVRNQKELQITLNLTAKNTGFPKFKSQDELRSYLSPAYFTWEMVQDNTHSTNNVSNCGGFPLYVYGNITATQQFYQENLRLFYKKANGKWYSTRCIGKGIGIGAVYEQSGTSGRVIVAFKGTKNILKAKKFKIGLKTPSGDKYMITHTDGNGKVKVTSFTSNDIQWLVSPDTDLSSNIG